MLMILAIAPMRVEDHDRATLEWFAFDGAVDIIEALDAAAHQGAQ